MLICICNAISEDQLRGVARQGISDPETAFAALGKTPNCRTCLDHADDVLYSEQRRCGRTCPSVSQGQPVFATA